MKKQIPNIITLLNLFSGCIAIVMAFNGNFLAVVIWVIVAAIFDFFDGFAARALGVSSKLGVELDSLADVVSFGVAPAAAVFVMLKQFTLYPDFLLPAKEIIPYSAFLISVFSAYRLAKFNIDTRQTTSFLGLPTPANGLFWITYVYGTHLLSNINEFYLYLTIGFILILSLLMVSEIPMFSLKIKNLKLKGNEKQLLLIVLMIVFVLLWKIIGIAWGILGYIAISIATLKKKKSIR
ncbi:MAG: CDP-diacylglycerol--serine O-phosphatidyltransferase [Bacteroidia bacterium]|nr:CDP-diacylglycerol--serine O-phosphatidyltransferase [Bacteroidia bacterium]